MRPVIVIVAYNREKSLERLLKSLCEADYGDYKEDPVQLIISIDKSDNEKVLETAESFKWDFGNKRIIVHDENQGLKKHVMASSALAEDYGSVIILEDDLMVSWDFYNYAAAALDFAKGDERIGGISLYNHRLNVHAREPFEPLSDGSDGWYFQFASSWGQAFSAKQWREFAQWMKTGDNSDISVKAPNGKYVPENVCSWGNKSWLKYFIRFLVEKDKYFLYPTVSHTTNFSEEGTHSMGQAADLQVPLLYSRNKTYTFNTLDASYAVYDAYFENERLGEFLDDIESCDTDLYGKKLNYNGRYVLSSRALPYRIIDSYARELRPLEANVIRNIKGNALFLYDTSEAAAPPVVDDTERYLYNYRAFKAKHGIDIILRRIKNSYVRNTGHNK